MSECIIPEEAKQLTKAQCLIEDEKKDWCQGHFRFGLHDGTAKFCAIGAVREVINGDNVSSYASGRLVDYLNDAAKELYGGHRGIMAVNDHVGHKAVMECFDHAVRKLIKEANPK